MTRPATTPELDPELVGNLERTLGSLVRTARANVRAVAYAIDTELDPSTYAVLIYLEKHPGVRMSEVAAAQCVGKGTMSRQIARLEKLAFVERTTDPADNRGQLLRLTAQAEEQVRVVRLRQAQRLRAVLAEWDPADVSQLTELVGRLLTDFDATRQRD